jgi:hypothetical protein
MSINGLVGSAAIALALAGTIAGACKRTGATGTQETSTIPNNSVPDNNTTGLVSSKSKAEASRNLGAELAAW